MKIKHVFTITLLVLILSSCKIFDSPSGNVEIIVTDLYDSGSYKYCVVYFKITNISKVKIYSSTVSLQVSTTKNRIKISTVKSSISIPSQKAITESCTFSFIPEIKETNTTTEEIESEEEWDINSIIILDSFFE